MPTHILICDNDASSWRNLTSMLEDAGYRVQTAPEATAALASARRELPDLLLLDLGLPGMDGISGVREFRALGDLPLLLLTSHRSDVDEAVGLALGADDYIAKACDPAVMLARIRLALRHYARGRHPAPRSSRLEVGDLTIDPATHAVTVGERAVALPPRAFDLLYALAQRPGEVISSDELVMQVWGAEYKGERQVLYVHIRWLREKLEDDPEQPRRIMALWRSGYRLVPQGV